MKRAPEVVSHFVHELSPPNHEHSESLPEGQLELNESFNPANEKIRFWATSLWLGRV